MTTHATEDKVRLYIERHRLFPPKTPLLAAVSGGIDSMVSVEILRRLGYLVGLAHCNFKLRMPDSDRDRDFVRQYAESSGLRFHTVEFDTEGFAGDHKISIQEAARIQRYDWLEATRREHGYHFTITGHHMLDNAETVLYNLTKNTGLRGLHGIRPKRERIARPLLCLGRSEIVAYVKANDIPFNEDATNTSIKYSRNFIRLKVIPELEYLNPKAVEAIDGLSQKAAEAELLMAERMEQIKRRITTSDAHGTEIRVGYILQHAAGRTILYELLKDFNFNEEQSRAVYENLGGQSGAEFLSASHRVIKDRKSLFVLALDSEWTPIRQWDHIPKQILFNNYKVQVRVAPVEKVNMKANPGYAYLDMEKINFPLTMRYWKRGDYFYPFGLGKDHSDKPGKKKLSKYFKDQKIPIHEKEKLPVLFSGEHLIWLVGHRIDHRFRVTDQTKKVLKMKILNR